MLLLVCLVSKSVGRAQDASMRPSHASEAVAALEKAQWERLEDGLELIQVNTALGTRIDAIRIDREQYYFKIVEQNRPNGERVRRVQRRLGAAVVVNGGFFKITKDSNLEPVGMLILDGEARSDPWSVSGGYIALDHQGTASITLSPEGPPMWARHAVQTRPVLIEPGGRWAMNTNGTELEHRTLFCLLPDGDAVIVVVHGGGLTLFEAGWLLRAGKWGGYFGCDSAIALDGGGSSQIAVSEREDLYIPGVTRVQNFLAVMAKGDQE